MQVMFDTNIILDILLDRPPFAEPAAILLAQAEHGQIQGFVCTTSVITIFYLARILSIDVSAAVEMPGVEAVITADDVPGTPYAVEIDEAANPSATPLYDRSPRVSPPEEVTCGDIEKGFAEADVIVEGEYTVPVREHAAMEPESALA